MKAYNEEAPQYQHMNYRFCRGGAPVLEHLQLHVHQCELALI